jgi:hypothetical protein
LIQRWSEASIPTAPHSSICMELCGGRGVFGCVTLTELLQSPVLRGVAEVNFEGTQAMVSQAAS